MGTGSVFRGSGRGAVAYFVNWNGRAGPKLGQILSSLLKYYVSLKLFLKNILVFFLSVWA